MSLSNYLEDLIGNALRGGTAGTNITAPAHVYAKLHTGDPGEAGTSNAAANTTRVEITFGASSGGVITSNASVDWTNVPNAETYSHISLWDASTGGNCLGSGALSASKTVAIGDNFSIPSTNATITLD